LSKIHSYFFFGDFAHWTVAKKRYVSVE